MFQIEQSIIRLIQDLIASKMQLHVNIYVSEKICCVRTDDQLSINRVMNTTRCVLSSPRPQFTHQLFYISYAVRCTLLFPACTNINKGLLLTCIQDNLECAVSVVPLECNNYFLVEQLQD